MAAGDFSANAENQLSAVAGWTEFCHRRLYGWLMGARPKVAKARYLHCVCWPLSERLPALKLRGAFLSFVASGAHGSMVGFRAIAAWAAHKQNRREARCRVY